MAQFDYYPSPPPREVSELPEYTYRELLSLMEKARAMFEALALLFVPPTSVNLIEGTTTSTLADISTPGDGNIFTLEETVTTPGFDIEFTFTGLNSFSGLALKGRYQGSSSHWAEFQVYNYNSTLWDTFIHIQTAPADNYRFVRIPLGSNYISNREVIVKIVHPSNGNGTHDFYIDFLAVLQ